MLSDEAEKDEPKKSHSPQDSEESKEPSTGAIIENDEKFDKVLKIHVDESMDQKELESLRKLVKSESSHF